MVTKVRVERFDRMPEDARPIVRELCKSLGCDPNRVTYLYIRHDTAEVGVIPEAGQAPG